MKKSFVKAFAAAFAALVVAGACGTAHAEDSKVSATLGLVSRYIWRGQDLLGNNDPAIQPSITFGLPQDLSLNVWGSMGIGGPNEKNELDELDFTLSKSGSFSDQISWTFGHTYYTFHTSGPDESQETYAGVSFPKAPMKPAVFVYGDWGSDASRGYYMNVSGSQELSLGGKHVPSITMNVSAGYSDGQWSYEPGLSDVNLTLTAPIALSGATVSPFVTYTYVPDKASSADGTTSPPKINTQNELIGGVNVEFKF